MINLSFSGCGRCGGMLSLQSDSGQAASDQNRGGFETTFLSCGGCAASGGGVASTFKLPRKGVIELREPRATCPLCGFQVLAVKPGKGYEGGGYHLCPHCYSNPPEGSAEAKAGGDDFPCFKCTAGAICPLAGRVQGADRPVLACRACAKRQRGGGSGGGGEGGSVQLKRLSKSGKFMLSCSRCSTQRFVTLDVTITTIHGRCRLRIPLLA